MIAQLRAIEQAKGDVERASELDAYSIFPEYLDAIIQFGYVSLFVVAFPLVRQMCGNGIGVSLRATDGRYSSFCRHHLLLYVLAFWNSN